MIGQFFVSESAGGSREILYGGEKVGIGVTELLQCGIVFAGHAFLNLFRYFVQQVVRKDTASVRGVDGGQTGHAGGYAAGADGVAAVQTALGVGDDIYLFTAGLLYDGADALRQFLPAGGHGSGGLLAAIVEDSAVLFQGVRDSAPVIKEVEIPEKYAVYQKDRVSGVTDLTLGAHLVQLQFFLFKSGLTGGDGDDPAQCPYMDKRDKAAGDTDDAPLDPQLDGGRIDADDAAPEKNELQQDKKKQFCQICCTPSEAGGRIWFYEKVVQERQDQKGGSRDGGDEKKF